MPQNVFVGRVAEYYDASSRIMFDPNILGSTVDFLAELASQGSALEFAVGTGRVAIPLSGRGIDVHGIDISEDMLAELRAKPGAAEIGVTVGDIATTNLEREFDLVYLVYNTISNLLTQEEQVQCFENAARHLRPGGCFVIELHLPELRKLPPGETIRAFDVTPNHLGFDEFDFVQQRLTSHHYWIADGQMEVFDSHHRYAWPGELDLMAHMAGMTLRERWAGWNRAPFTGESVQHISVWEKST